MTLKLCGVGLRSRERCGWLRLGMVREMWGVRLVKNTRGGSVSGKKGVKYVIWLLYRTCESP